jgi:hypothetical protein
LMIGSLWVIASKQIAKPCTQGGPTYRAERHYPIERGPGAGLNRTHCKG